MNCSDHGLNQILRMIDKLNRLPRPVVTRRPPPPPGMRYVSEAEYAKIQEAKKAEALAASTENADAELRADVVEHLIGEGFAPHVAANLTNTQAKMLEQARKCGII